jgi:RNA polymerase sigma-70 factor (ECF subfamily)
MRERSARVQLAIRRLSPRMREIIALRYFEGLSYEELASRLVIAGGSVRSRLHRAHAALGRGLSSLEGEPGTAS